MNTQTVASQTGTQSPLSQKNQWGWTALLLLSLVPLSSCGVSVVYRDTFDTTAIGQPPGPPKIGLSTADGDTVVIANPEDPASSDRWLELERNSPTGPLAQYVGTFEETITAGGSVNLVGYVPQSSPVTMSVYYVTPASAPQDLTLLHIDLLPNGNIRVNDNSIEGTYKFDQTVGFFVGFDLEANPPTATVLVRGGAEDASVDVEIPAAIANFGLGKVRVETPFEGVNAPQGKFFLNEIVATKTE